MNRYKFAINSMSGAVQLVCTALLTFIAIPVFLKMLGTESYGIFAVISVVGNLSVFANLGLNTSLIKFLSEQGRSDESDYDIAVTLYLISVVIIPLTIVLIIFNKFILLSILQIPPAQFEDARVLFILLLVANYFLLMGQTFTAVLDALQKIYLSNLFQLCYSFCYWGLILLFLFLGYSLQMVGVAILLAALCWFVLVGYSTFRLWGKLNLQKFQYHYRRIAKKQLSYGSKVYAHGLINFCYEPLTKILISALLGMHAVAFYDIALRIRSQLWGLIYKVNYPLYPLIAKTQDQQLISRTITSFQQKIILFIVPVIVIIIFCSHSFIALWLPSADLVITSNAVIFITSFYLLGITNLPVYYYLLAKNHVPKIILVQASNVVFNTVILLTGFKYLGFTAVILGNVTAVFASFFILLFYQKKLLNIDFFQSREEFQKISACFLLLVVLNVLLHSVISNPWLNILLVPVITIGIAVIFYIRYKLFTPSLRFSLARLRSLQQSS